MANLQNDQSDSPATPATLNANSTPKERKAANDTHHQTLIEHTLDSSDYNGHGHAQGRQGKAGHTMVSSDAHKQSGQYIPQAVFDTTSDGAGSAEANDASTRDYGVVDNKND
jgi:hypothetical protein